MRTIPCVLAAALLIGAVVGGWADDQPTVTRELCEFEGCGVGANTLPFKVTDVTGPYKGKTLCYV